jgi:hypothetical protein
MAGGDYGRIRHTFWTDPDIKRALTPEQKTLLLYYFTSPHRTLIGLYYCPLEYAAGETGIPLERVREWTFGALSRFVTYDEQTEEILVHRAGKHQVGDELKERDNQRKAIEKALHEAHSSCLVRKFLSLYAHWPIDFQAPPEPQPEEKKAPSEPLASPSEAIAVAEQGTTAEETLPNGSGGGPPEDESPEPDPDAVWNEARPRIAGLIRSVAWLGGSPPQVRTRGRQPWSMKNELSIAKELLKQFTPDELCGGLERYRETHGTPEDQQFTLALVYAEGDRWRISLAVEQWRQKLIDAGDPEQDERVRSLTEKLGGARAA